MDEKPISKKKGVFTMERKVDVFLGFANIDASLHNLYNCNAIGGRTMKGGMKMIHMADDSEIAVILIKTL